MKNSTFSQAFADAYPDRFWQGYIAEQNMVSVAVGMQARGKVPFVDTFACFLSRAYDNVRMAAISRANINLCGSHCGVSIGEDGPSQMALEDIAMFRASMARRSSIPATPSRLSASRKRWPGGAGVNYIRTSRPKMPILYAKDELFPVPGFKVLRKSADDKATVVGAGVTLHEALKAADELTAAGIAIRVVDLYCVKPLDGKALGAEVAAGGGRLVTVEDHWPEGGLGEAVLHALAAAGAALAKFKLLAVNGLPHSGKPEEVVDEFGISARHIVEALKAVSGGIL